ncbi:MAG: DUF309 domain-containing protein [Actinophytocola sp.]|nr:DUF309 domain-containing protein [Actinophytocola sp.]
MRSTKESQHTPRGRDRDDEGRARNARPRDGLGRPLPYGAAGVERQPEGVTRSPAHTIDDAQRLLDEGKPFHAHEVFEDAWKSSDDPDERQFWKGMAQLAVGLTHGARGNLVGGARLLRRGAEHIGPYAERPPHGIAVAALVEWADALAVELDDGEPIDAPAARAPRLRG